MSFAELSSQTLPATLRVVLMSGDWIPLSLPDRIRALSRNSSLQVISLGGATEASVWSNLYSIPPGGPGPGWGSIPYGRPLLNQELLVLNDSLKHCEYWVGGELYLAGMGVARGYHQAPSLTKAHFISHPVSREPMFRTGDLGRLRPTGEVELLGRKDLQVRCCCW